MSVIHHKCYRGCTRESSCKPCDYFKIGDKVLTAFPTERQSYPSTRSWDTLFFSGTLLNEDSGMSRDSTNWVINIDPSSRFHEYDVHHRLSRVYRHSYNLRKLYDSNDIEFHMVK